jgi:hypothetical protein
MSPQFWQGVVAATGGWFAFSLIACAVMAWFLQKGRCAELTERSGVAALSERSDRPASSQALGS